MAARHRSFITRALVVLSVLFFFLIWTSLSASDPRGVERRALLKFKTSVSDPTGILQSWSPAAGDHCSWLFVSCDSRSRVTSLNISLSCSELGSSDGICGDPRRKLDGSLNSVLGDLSELETLFLPSHGFYGEIPIEIWKLEKLVSINLSENSLNGTLPGIFPPNLRVLNLAGNLIGGEIPASISACYGMRTLDLSRNRFYGNIPVSLGNCTGLRVLLLSSNLLDGSIPLEFGRLTNLQVLDVSRNSLSGLIPTQLGSCGELSVLIITNPFDPVVETDSADEFNAFEGGIPENITMLPKLRVFWAPRATLEGQIPRNWGNCERLEMVNLGQNLLTGDIPAALSECNHLHFLNLSSNKLTGQVSSDLPVSCMDVFDVSENKLSGPIPNFAKRTCATSFDLTNNDFVGTYYNLFLSEARKRFLFSSPDLGFVYHNFGHNSFTGSLVNLPISVEKDGNQTVYTFIADRNNITGTLDAILLEKCGIFKGLILNLQENKISGGLSNKICSRCQSLLVLSLSHNHISGIIPQNLGSLDNLLTLDLSHNWLKGQIPESVNQLHNLKYLSFSNNNLTGAVPFGFDQLKSLEVLDLSSNSLSGAIPTGLSNLKNLTTLLFNSNNLSGNIPGNFVFRILNVSFNNLTGSLPSNSSAMSCNSFQGNPSLQPCKPISLSVPSSDVSQANVDSPPESSPTGGSGGGFSSIEIASITSASAIVSVLLALIILYIYTRKCLSRPSRESHRRREVTPFVDIGVPITYECVVRSTGNFNASNCIGSGGFGATYKAEIAPGVLVAIKRLAVGRFQGAQQFQAEVKTLGRCQHPNLVTLIGYHLGDSEMFLIYNYLPGGNLERFIQERCKRPIDWRMLHKIALDVAQALAFLHDSCVPRILHRDVKPSNILLDTDFNAYLSDFGLARLLGNSETHATTGVAGTFGYVAPEYAMTCRVSDKADVYSYGVVLLELISNKKALDPSFSPYGNGFNIVAWACMLLQKGRAKEFFVEGLWDVAPHDDLVEILHLGIKCTVDSLSTRPTMKHVVRRLRELRPPSF
ncbi:receptor-like protein kinase 2 [Rhynchospora pubera]|uniref:non-specific serine/threonine protein kinase n=1 Tax=Rhynchospora pubera TaxID=906938 RepID=A0AAV8CZ79_9POAL|nr:receptor-like protein kinase 2 [Rhynchospora pubera]